MHSKNITYRPDIDGLRAIAVLSVVIYHINKLWLPGGFVGVDIFFVISGFLITGIIHKQNISNGFSFIDFYKRRARRILPAAFTVILTTYLIGAAFMLPIDIENLKLSAIASTLSLANVYFWKFLDTSYFAKSSDMIPLLHMWSLGIEEQFYIIWPAIFLVLYKIFNKPSTIIIASTVAAASFFIGQSTLAVDQSFSYYMLPSRAGELLIGAIVFLILEGENKKLSRPAREIISISGSALIVYSIVMTREAAGFPGYASIIPSIGAGLLIAAGFHGKTIISQVISIKPMRAIGLISFSLYLWHWPVMAFYRYGYGEPSTSVEYMLCISLMAFLSIMSYELVEKPFRINTGKHEALKYSAIAVLAAAIVAVPFVFSNSDGTLKFFGEQNFEEKTLSMAGKIKSTSDYPYNCQLYYNLINQDTCVIGSGSGEVETLIIGDSNAAHYVGYLKAIAESSSIKMRNFTQSACIPFPGTTSHDHVAVSYRESCIQYNEIIRKEFGKYKTIFVSADWPNYLGDIGPGFDSLLSELSENGRKVIVGLKAPVFINYDRDCSIKSIRIPFLSCEKLSEYKYQGELDINKKLKAIIAKHKNVSSFSVDDEICRSGKCSPYLHGEPIYYDKHHISMEGSISLGKQAIELNEVPESIKNI